MKVLISVPYYRHGGIEKNIIATIEELLEQIDKVIFVSSDRNLEYFRKLLPKSDKLVFESFRWEPNSQGNQLLTWIYRFRNLFQKLKISPLKNWLETEAAKARYDRRLNHIAQKHGATHCVYFMVNGVAIPNLNIPLIGTINDLYWHFAPLTYPQDYIDRYDRSVKEWLQKADLILSISEKTRHDLLYLFPKFQQKVVAIPLSGFPQDEANATPSETAIVPTQPPTFYFPSSVGIYKDQLALLEGGVRLAHQGAQFKIVLVGKATDSLIQGNLKLSQQDKTQEFIDYFEACQQLYHNHKDIFQNHFEGWGYVEYSQVEQGYRDCACVVFPSKYEGFGFALAEAIVRGIPVICSDLEVFKEQIDLYKASDRVDIFPVGDADALANCMAKFLENPKPRLSQAEIQERFGHWKWENVIQAYVKTLATVSRNSR